MRRRNLLDAYRELTGPTFRGRREYLYADFQRRVDASENAIQVHRRQVDAMTDAIGNIAATVAAIIVSAMIIDRHARHGNARGRRAVGPRRSQR